MLELRLNCECCGRDLPPDSAEAMICTFECTFCSACANRFDRNCPTCGGNLEKRPVRPARLLRKYPPAAARTPIIADCQR